MLNRLHTMKYFFCFLTLIIFSGCASIPKNTNNRDNTSDCAAKLQNKGYKVYIADIEWVKLYPNETFQEDYLKKMVKKYPDGDFKINNGCGKAEIQYKIKNGLHIHVWMGMGEWCKNPFDNNLDTQLIVVDPKDNRLVEYHPIEETNTMGEVVLLYERYQLMYSIFSDFVKPLTEPLFLMHSSETNKEWIEMMIREGIIEESDDEIWILKGVYLSDIIKCYEL